MKGNIIGFDADTNTGAISGYDGGRYEFVTLDWREQGRPHRGDVVDFQPDGQRATQIYLLEPAYVAPGFGIFYFSASGRISRSQYWLRFMLPYFAITFGLEAIAGANGDKSVAHTVVSPVISIFCFLALWPSFAILIKRLHDRDKSGWWCLFLYAPLIVFTVLLAVWLTHSAAAIVTAAMTGSFAAVSTLGALGLATVIFGAVSAGIGLWFFIEFGCLRGTEGANRFGPDPVR